MSDVILEPDNVLMAKPWRARTPTVMLQINEVDKDLVDDLKGDEYHQLVMHQVHCLMQRLDSLGNELS